MEAGKKWAERCVQLGACPQQRTCKNSKHTNNNTTNAPAELCVHVCQRLACLPVLLQQAVELPRQLLLPPLQLLKADAHLTRQRLKLRPVSGVEVVCMLLEGVCVTRQ